MRLSTLLLAAILPLAALPTQAWAQGRSIPKGTDAQAQEDAEQEVIDILPDGQKYRYPLLNGLNISVDVFDPVLSLFALDHCTYEAQAMLDLHHRYFPLVALGMGLADEKSNNGLDYGFPDEVKRELRFKSDPALFGKVGLAYNLNYNDIHPDDLYLAMVRYGIAHNTADITNLYYANDVWGALGPIDITDQSYTTQWLELGGMIKVQVWKRFSLGWDLYWKVKLYQSGTQVSKPYYVPGMGTTQSSIGFSFRVYYEIF